MGHFQSRDSCGFYPAASPMPQMSDYFHTFPRGGVITRILKSSFFFSMIAEGAFSAEGKRLDGVLALPLAESPQGLLGHSYGVAEVCRDFHTSKQVGIWSQAHLYAADWKPIFFNLSRWRRCGFNRKVSALQMCNSITINASLRVRRNNSQSQKNTTQINEAINKLIGKLLIKT